MQNVITFKLEKPSHLSDGYNLCRALHLQYCLIFFAEICTRFLIANVYKITFGIFIFFLDFELSIKM